MNDENESNYKEIPLSRIVELSQNGDLKALEELIKREQNSIYVTLCYLNDHNTDPHDLTQEVLIRMSKNIKKLKNPQVFKSWLNQITMHVFYDSLRKKNRQPQMYYIDSDEDDAEKIHLLQIPDKHQKPDENTLVHELDKKIKESIFNLPVSFRMPIILREFQGLSYEEIAQSLNTNIGTVKSRIARARNKLQEDLKPYIT